MTDAISVLKGLQVLISQGRYVLQSYIICRVRSFTCAINSTKQNPNVEHLSPMEYPK
jgi:hypothetical protein